MTVLFACGDKPAENRSQLFQALVVQLSDEPSVQHQTVLNFWTENVTVKLSQKVKLFVNTIIL